MPDPHFRQKNEVLLRRRLSGFLGNHSIWKRPLRRALNRISDNSWPAVIFGGVLRDLVVADKREVPRDVDVVVQGVTSSDLEEVFRDLIVEKNRFGGLRLRTGGWLIDVWCLQDTWAFRNRLTESRGLTDLVNTTFLNVEAVAAEIRTKRGCKRQIFAAGFFEAIDRQMLDINFEANPHPGLCIVRSILMAIRLDFLVSRKLAMYLLDKTRSISTTELAEIQESHYGKIRIREQRLNAVLASLRDQLTDSNNSKLRIPSTRSEQLELWKYWTPAC